MKARAAATPVALILLASGALAYAYFVDDAKVSDADRAARRQEVFPSFRVDEVERMELSRGADVLVLERDTQEAGPGAPQPWIMTSPRRDRADATAVDVLLRELELATRLRDVDDTTPFGLDAPRARGKVRVGAIEYRFELGADAPRPEGAAYLRVDGEGTFVVGQALKVQLLRGADAYRDRRIVPLGASDIARVEIHAADGSGVALERNGATFRIAGVGLRASRAAVDRLMSAIVEARADNFLEDDEPGRDDVWSRDAMRVLLTPIDPYRGRVEYRVAPTCPGQVRGAMVVRTAPTRLSACTARSLVDALDVTAESLADRSPFFAHADEIEELRLESTDGSGIRVDVARKGTGWRERAPQDRNLDTDESDAVSRLAAALADARSESLPSPGAREPIAVRARVTLVRTGSGESETIELGQPGPDGASLVRRQDDAGVIRLTRAVARRFEPHPIALRPRAIWRTPFDAGSVLAIDNGCAPSPERLELREGAWTMTNPGGFSADPGTAVDRTEALAGAKAEAWIAERDDGTFGFDRPGACSVTVSVTDAAIDAAPTRASLLFGEESGEGVYARMADDPAVFVLGRALRDLFSGPAVDRSGLRVDTAALASVVLSRDDSRVVLERAGGRLTRRTAADGGGGASDEDAGSDQLGFALAGIYAESAVHTGPPARGEGLDKPTLEITVRPLEASETQPSDRRITIGSPGRADADDVYFARVSGVDATFVVPRRSVRALLEAW